MRRALWRHALAGTAFLAASSGAAWGIVEEMRTSELQAEALAWVARELTFSIEPGPNPAARFPTRGPYDRRFGYIDLPSYIDSLAANHFVVEHQARVSSRLYTIMTHGGLAIFRENTRAGLTLNDRDGKAIFTARFPERAYSGFDAIPPLVVDTLLFIENRELLDPRFPNHNPAIEWDRLGTAVFSLIDHLMDPNAKVTGGSTLATQIEKYRHSPEGQTATVVEKLRQIIFASIRSYLDGPDTTKARRRIVVDYLNSTPLAGRHGFGEIIGIGDGLWAWYGADFETANRVLRETKPDARHLKWRAHVYRQVLSLLIAQRRPSAYLVKDREALATLTDRYLFHLAAAGVIDPALRDTALGTTLHIIDNVPAPRRASFVERKAANAVRAEMLSLLGVPGLYELDRLDVTVAITIDMRAQKRVTEVLQRLSDPAYAEALGLTGHHMLGAGDPRDVVYSVTVYERGPDANYVRVQADNLDQPLDISEGTKLDLGSTAKLRTLITYLETVARLHVRYAYRSSHELDAVARDATDPLTRWAVRHLSAAADRGLTAMLEAAMARRYSASPAERFFTGGGVHRFDNFSHADDGRTMSVAQAFRNSVNLVFIRLMRDIVRYQVAQLDVPAHDMLADISHPARALYLARFADREGGEFLNRFYEAYRGRNPDDVLARIASRSRSTPRARAILFHSLRPRANVTELTAFLRVQFPDTAFDEADVADRFAEFAMDRLPLSDLGHIAGVHPLELWLSAYLQDHPQARLPEILAASTDARQAAYAWLFRTKSKIAQDLRIRIMLEEEAFERIHRSWQRLGYPFDSLVPSYATVIGSSADRPDALAELMGIIVNGGIRRPTVRITRLRFASDTPYETEMAHGSAAGERVLEPEVAAIVRNALVDTVKRGTARRLNDVFVGRNGVPLTVGAKTGTGDHRYKQFARGGRLIGSRVVNRNAAVVFFIGDRIFGTITAHVSGARASRHRFTSSLPVQLLKALGPSLQPILDHPSEPGTMVGRQDGTATNHPAPQIAATGAPLKLQLRTGDGS